MEFTRSVLTNRGVDLNAQLLHLGEPLKITQAVGGSGAITTPLETLEQVQNKILDFEVHVHPVRVNQRLTIPLYYTNNGFSGDDLTHVALYAYDYELEEDILYAVAASDSPLPIPSHTEGRMELSFDFIIELSNDVEVHIYLNSKIYLTRVEADALYATRNHGHTADQIGESTGETTEVVNRRQDSDIEMLKRKSETGTSNAVTVKKSAAPYDQWEVIDHKGIYGISRQYYYA